MTVLLERYKWARCILFLAVLPGVFTYLTLTSWLRANECWSLLRHPINNINGEAPATSPTNYISSDILECRLRGIPLPSDSNPSIVRLTQSMMRDYASVYTNNNAPDMDKIWLFSTQRNEEESAKSTSAASTTVNRYGFRSNKNKGKSQQKTVFVPYATYFLGAINIGLYWAYWNYRVDPARIVHNTEIVHDYGRAFTSTFGHFEIWHVGINMMTLFSLGNMLEQQVYGSIPFFMYTMSFVPLAAIVVVLLQRFTSPSSMVGFSGILFAWSVVATLSSSRSCPIMFLPDFCFSTYQLFGVPVSMGPLVQLVFLQVVLPRVSFVGHLSGIIVGFFWHWNLLPPLEWLQPSILFPILWSIGKLVLPRFLSLDDVSTVASRGGISGGYTVGSSESGGASPLGWILNALIVHCCILGYGVGVWNSITMSEILLVLVLVVTVNARKSGIGDINTVHSDWAMMGRGYVIFVCITLITDGMTIVGWILLSRRITGVVACCMVLRLGLLHSSLCMMCHMLHVANQTLPGSIWFHACHWLIVEACHPIGGWLISHLEQLSSSIPSRGGSRYSRLLVTTKPPASSLKNNESPQVVSNVV